MYAVWQLAYTVPRITKLVVTRCDASGNVKEDGTCAKVSFNWATDKTVSSVKIEWKQTTATTWSSATVTSSGTSGSVAQVVGSSAISVDNTYGFRISVADSGGTSTTTTVIGGLAYAIDFKAGGTGVAFGKPAETDDLVDIAWNTMLSGNLTMRNADNIYMKNTSGTDRNALHMNISNHLNLGYGGYRVGEGQTNVYGDKVNLVHTNGLMINNTAVNDFVVEVGTSNSWTYRKWNSGRAEAWRICDLGEITPSASGSLYYTKHTFSFPTIFKAVPIVTGNLYGNYMGGISLGRDTTTTNCVFYVFTSTNSSRTNYDVNLYASGVWK